MTSITDELRSWAEGDALRAGMSLRTARDQALTIADRIDAELAERYVALPLDADGVPIHFGDVLSQFGTPMTVFAMSDPDPDQGDCMLELITDDGISGSTWVRARKMRHHTPDTWECIIEDAIRGDGGSYGCLEERFNATVPVLVARCKALAGEDA